MTYTLVFSPGAAKGIAKLKKSQPLYYKKLRDILEELTEHPRVGTGHPEPLKGAGQITWSRHISKKDVIIYDLHDDIVEVHIIQVGNHYDDK